MAYAERKVNSISNMNTALAISTTVQTLTTQSATSQRQSKNLENQIQSIKAQISDIQLSVETSEKEFIDKKAVYTGPKRIQTLQDLVLAFFFLAYSIFAIILTILYYKTNKNISTTGGIFFAFFMFGLLLVELVRRYA